MPKKTTEIYIILDKSGSMYSVQDTTISAYNEYVNSLKKDKKSDYKLSLTLFDTEFCQLYERKSLKDVEDLDRVKYDPDGCTALYDAVCSTLNRVKKSRKKSLVVIITDGLENSSKKYTEKEFKELVEDLTAKKNWTFVYLGANQDAWANAVDWGFKEDNVSTYNASARGVEGLMVNLAHSTCVFSASMDLGTEEFYTPEQKKEMENTK
jgi:hypothetical protein